MRILMNATLKCILLDKCISHISKIDNMEKVLKIIVQEVSFVQ